MNRNHPDGDAVSGSLSPGDASATRWHVVVVGAGPAGTATARRLARSGWRVVILDRSAFPRAKVCGCCLSPSAVAELVDLDGAPGTVPAVGLSTVRLASGGRAARIRAAAGMVVSRETLDTHLLRRAIDAGCAWVPEARVTAIDDRRTAGGGPVIVTVAGDGDRRWEIEADTVVMATGLFDGVRAGPGLGRSGAGRGVAAGSRIGIGTILNATVSDLPPGELVMAVSTTGYCGVVRLDDGRIDVAAAVDRRALASAPPARVVAGILGGALGRGVEQTLGAALGSAPFRATPALTRRRGAIDGVSGRVIRVGDAVGYVEPFTGEGIGWALESARMLAASIGPCRGRAMGPDAARAYAAAHRRRVDPRHRRCRFVAGAVRYRSVVTATLLAARTLPGAARAILPLVVGARHAGDLP